MTAHQLNNVIARCWIQHIKNTYDPYSSSDYKEQVKKIEQRIVNELNSEFYKNNKDLIESLKDKPVVNKFIYNKYGLSLVGKYPLQLFTLGYDSTFSRIVKADPEYQNLITQTEVINTKKTTDRGFYYVQCMLLYKVEMTETDFYNSIRKYFTIIKE